MESFMNMVRAFAFDDDGAQIIEYALIVAVVSLGLIVLMMGATGLDFAGWIGRVNTCLGTGPCV